MLCCSSSRWSRARLIQYAIPRIRAATIMRVTSISAHPQHSCQITFWRFTKQAEGFSDLAPFSLRTEGLDRIDAGSADGGQQAGEAAGEQEDGGSDAGDGEVE